MRLLKLAFLVPFNPGNEPYYPKICQNCDNVEGKHCKLFGNVDLISGKRYFLSCEITRQNETMCGVEGKFFSRYVPFEENK